LIWVNKVRRDRLNLESFTNNFLNKLSKYIVENDKSKSPCRIISCFIWFGNNNESGHLKVWWPKSKIDTHISNIDKIQDIFVVSYQNFKKVLRNVIGSRSEWAATFFDSIIKFHFRKYRPLRKEFCWNFIKQIQIDLPTLSRVKYMIKNLPKVF